MFFIVKELDGRFFNLDLSQLHNPEIIARFVQCLELYYPMNKDRDGVFDSFYIPHHVPGQSASHDPEDENIPNQAQWAIQINYQRHQQHIQFNSISTRNIVVMRWLWVQLLQAAYDAIWPNAKKINFVENLITHAYFNLQMQPLQLKATDNDWLRSFCIFTVCEQVSKFSVGRQPEKQNELIQELQGAKNVGDWIAADEYNRLLDFQKPLLEALIALEFNQVEGLPQKVATALVYSGLSATAAVERVVTETKRAVATQQKAAQQAADIQQPGIEVPEILEISAQYGFVEQFKALCDLYKDLNFEIVKNEKQKFVLLDLAITGARQMPLEGLRDQQFFEREKMATQFAKNLLVASVEITEITYIRSTLCLYKSVDADSAVHQHLWQSDSEQMSIQCEGVVAALSELMKKERKFTKAVLDYLEQFQKAIIEIDGALSHSQKTTQEREVFLRQTVADGLAGLGIVISDIFDQRDIKNRIVKKLVEALDPQLKMPEPVPKRMYVKSRLIVSDSSLPSIPEELTETEGSQSIDGKTNRDSGVFEAVVSVGEEPEDDAIALKTSTVAVESGTTMVFAKQLQEILPLSTPAVLEVNSGVSRPGVFQTTALMQEVVLSQQQQEDLASAIHSENLSLLAKPVEVLGQTAMTFQQRQAVPAIASENTVQGRVSSQQSEPIAPSSQEERDIFVDVPLDNIAPTAQVEPVLISALKVGLQVMSQWFQKNPRKKNPSIAQAAQSNTSALNQVRPQEIAKTMPFLSLNATTVEPVMAAVSENAGLSLSVTTVESVMAAVSENATSSLSATTAGPVMAAVSENVTPSLSNNREAVSWLVTSLFSEGPLWLQERLNRTNDMDEAIKLFERVYEFVKEKETLNQELLEKLDFVFKTVDLSTEQKTKELEDRINIIVTQLKGIQLGGRFDNWRTPGEKASIVALWHAEQKQAKPQKLPYQQLWREIETGKATLDKSLLPEELERFLG